jgi:hypothetical protein
LKDSFEKFFGGRDSKRKDDLNKSSSRNGGSCENGSCEGGLVMVDSVLVDLSMGLTKVYLMMVAIERWVTILSGEVSTFNHKRAENPRIARAENRRTANTLVGTSWHLPSGLQRDRDSDCGTTGGRELRSRQRHVCRPYRGVWDCWSVTITG